MIAPRPSHRSAVTGAKRRGFTLIEAVAVIVVIGIAVPPTLLMLREVVEQRTDAISLARATSLANAVLETVVADVASGDENLGFDALVDETLYVDGGTRGLRTRLATVTAPYTAARLSYAVDIGPLSAADGSITGDVDLDLFRVVTVSVTFPTIRGQQVLNLSTMVADL